MNADKILIRCSMIGDIMPSDNAKTKWTNTQLDKLVEVYNATMYGRREELKSKYLDKGNAREEDCIDLISLNFKRMFRKNKERKSNLFITGEWDMDNVNAIETTIDHTLDAKASWSKITFDKVRIKGTDSNYIWQGHGYMALTGAKKHTICHCLVNGTFDQVMREKYIARYDFIDWETSEAYINKCKQIEINHIFDRNAFAAENSGFDFHIPIDEWKWDVPTNERFEKFEIERDDKKILAIYNRVKECREMINEKLIYHERPTV